MKPTAPQAPLPVYLLTGFLGSGKTTLLSRLVRSAAFADTAVIINEFGQVGLDHRLVASSNDDDVVLLDSGCLCCATNSALQDSLESLYYRRLRGDVPAFARVVVETSGLADPAPLINTLAGDPSVARHYRFGGAITTVDGIHGLRTLDDYREAATQAAVADKLIITKTDVTPDPAVHALREALRARNPMAPIVTATAHACEGEAVLFDGLHRTAPVSAGPAANDRTSTFSPAVPLALTRLGHVLRYGIASYVCRVEAPVTWPAYAAWVKHLQTHFGENLLRVKALLPMSDGQTYAIHGVRHLFSPPDPIDTAAAGDQLGTIVIIAQAMSEEDVAQAQAVLTRPT
ncbi:CobW family GTP-binding protein [Schauerella aestuarii]|uniref:CobW family GTP-binding protein n=1 Tax=Schauerella aestuarii TaxID=2511204 RepID=UPI001927131B|nr:GTP-binding protein [Achromobacter aestuarii]